MIQAACLFYVYFVVFAHLGYHPSVLPWNGWTFVNLKNPPFNGFSNTENMRDLGTAQGAAFGSIVMMQVVNMQMTRTMRVSIFKHGLGNDQANFGIFFELLLTCGLFYLPGVKDVFFIGDIIFIYWLIFLPFGAFAWVYDEGRKWWCRKYDSPENPSWIAWSTIY